MGEAKRKSEAARIISDTPLDMALADLANLRERETEFLKALDAIYQESLKCGHCGAAIMRLARKARQ